MMLMTTSEHSSSVTWQFQHIYPVIENTIAPQHCKSPLFTLREIPREKPAPLPMRPFRPPLPSTALIHRVAKTGDTVAR
jgi:hypothetical protein